MAAGIFNSILFSFVGPVPVDAKFTEAHQREAEVATFTLEDGNQVSDHVVRKPRKVNITFLLSSEDNIVISSGIRVGLNTAYGIKAAGLFFVLDQLWKRAIPFAVLTRHWLYRDMVITHLVGGHNAPKSGSLYCTITLQNIPTNTMTNLERPASELESLTGIDKTGSSLYQSGTVLGYPITNVAIYSQAENAAFEVL